MSKSHKSQLEDFSIRTVPIEERKKIHSMSLLQAVLGLFLYPHYLLEGHLLQEWTFKALYLRLSLVC